VQANLQQLYDRLTSALNDNDMQVCIVCAGNIQRSHVRKLILYHSPYDYRRIQ